MLDGRGETAGELVEELRVVFLEDRLKSGPRSFFHRMDFLDKAVNVGGHHKEITNRSRPRIPIGVRGTFRYEDGGSGANLNVGVADADAQNALEDIPSLVVAVMKVERSDEAGR